MLLTPSPVINCHTFSDPSPSSVTYFMDGPIGAISNRLLISNNATPLTQNLHYL